MATYGLEYGNDVGVVLARANGAAVDKDRRPVQARQAHDAAGHVLVAAADGNNAVVAHAAGDGFDGVGNDLARYQRVLHAFGAHGYAIGDGDGVIDHAFAARRIDAGIDRLGQGIDVHVAGRHHAPGGGHANLSFAEVITTEACRMQHGAAGGALDAVHHLAGMCA